jgi:hypothetical protein
VGARVKWSLQVLVGPECPELPIDRSVSVVYVYCMEYGASIEFGGQGLIRVCCNISGTDDTDRFLLDRGFLPLGVDLESCWRADGPPPLIGEVV